MCPSGESRSRAEGLTQRFHGIQKDTFRDVTEFSSKHYVSFIDLSLCFDGPSAKVLRSLCASSVFVSRFKNIFIIIGLGFCFCVSLPL